MNKKIIAALCGLLVGGTAVAEDYRFYVGADLGYNKHKYGETIDGIATFISTNGGTSEFKKKAPTFGVFAGVKYCDNFGAELGYTGYKKAKASATLGAGNSDGSIKASSIYADLLGYMPICNEFNLIGSVGLGRASVKTDLTHNAAAAAAMVAAGLSADNVKTNKVGFRLGLGGEYKFDDNFAARAMVRFQKVGKKNDVSIIKSLTSFNLGLTYTI